MRNESMNKRQLERLVLDLSTANSLLQSENEILREKLNRVDNDRKSIRVKKVVKDYIALSESEFLALSAANKNKMIFNLLNALCEKGK